MKLNRILSIAAAVGMVFAAVSCGESEKKSDTNLTTLEEAEQIFASSLESTDTATVLAMGNAFMESLKNGQIDEALDQLYTREMTDSLGSPRKLNESERQVLRQRFERFPVMSYTIAHYDFSIPSLNDLKYTYVYNPEKANGKMNLMFNPMKRGDGNWYLMLKQPDQPAKDAQNALPPTAGISMPDDK